MSGQSHATDATAWPPSTVALARRATSAGATRKPHSALSAVSGFGARLSCAMRPAYTMSHNSRSTVTTKKTSVGVPMRGTSASRLLTGAHCARVDASHEHVDRALRVVVRGGREHVEQQHAALGEGVHGDVTALERVERAHAGVGERAYHG